MPVGSDSPATIAIARALRQRGPLLAKDARAAARVSPATFTRAVAAMRTDLVTNGATRSLTLGLRRTIPGLPRAIPIYELLPGTTRTLAWLHPVEPGGFFVESPFPVRGFHPGLPWFLHDLRPAGFLGRLAPRQNPELGLPSDILAWSGDHVLRWLHEWGVDTVGSFVIGDPAFGRVAAHEAHLAVAADDRERRYPELAAGVMNLGVPGSSAAGEQPKFLATRVGAGASTPVLVKFSPQSRDLGARRTADLLRCEHHALTTLREAGIAAASSSLVEADGRVFLEVERFDRAGGGRRGLVSLSALAAHEGVDLSGWGTSMDQIFALNRVSGADRDRAQLLDRFGQYIGNTDRHAGNLSFFFEDGAVGRLAPVYDMLPMLYAVRGGEISTPALLPPSPTPNLPDAWRAAWSAALAFWAVVAEDGAIHGELRDVARFNHQRIVEQRPMLSRLPGA